MSKPISQEALAKIFTEARSHKAWTKKEVSNDLLREIYHLCKWGPTSMNCSPMRILFVRSDAEKAKLLPALGGSNPDQVKAAPVTAIIAMDMKFYYEMPTLFPAYPDAKKMFAANEEMTDITAKRNSSLQGAYFMIAARSLGLDCGPMSGFDNAKVDAAFFKDSSWKSNFICNIGYGEASKLFPRGPRLSFEQVCKIV